MYDKKGRPPPVAIRIRIARSLLSNMRPPFRAYSQALPCRSYVIFKAAAKQRKLELPTTRMHATTAFTLSTA